MMNINIVIVISVFVENNPVWSLVGVLISIFVARDDSMYHVEGRKERRRLE